MRTFAVSINGKHLCTAGIGAEGVLISSVTWSGSNGNGHFHMHVGGLDTTSNQHIEWQKKEIGVGDEIVTRIIESEVVDPPVSSRSKAEIEALSKQFSHPGFSTTARFNLLNSDTGTWDSRGEMHLTVLPRVGEWVRLASDLGEVITRIVMVVHSEASDEAGEVNLYAVVEGDLDAILKSLAGGR